MKTRQWLVMRKIAYFGILITILIMIHTISPLVDQNEYQSIQEIEKRTLSVSIDNRLNITDPSGGEIISGVITIEWTILEELIDSSTSYQVHYSPDWGSNWIILSIMIFETTYIWNTTLYEDYCKDCILRISAQNKLFEIFSILSNTFIIDNRKINGLNEVFTYAIIIGIFILLGSSLFQ